MLVFEERGKPEYPEKNLSEQSREPMNSTHILYMTPGSGIEPGTHWWKASALTTASTLLPYAFFRIKRNLSIQSILHLLSPPISSSFHTLQGVCVAVAALAQYFFIAAFCWMLVEGIYLYLFVVKVYNVGNKLKICHGMSWGKPSNVSFTNCPVKSI